MTPLASTAYNPVIVENNYDTRADWVDVPKPGGWKLVLDSKEDGANYQLFKKEVDFELGKSVKRVDVGVFVENNNYVYRIEFTFLGEHGHFVDGAIINFAEGGIIVPPLKMNSSMIEEFKTKVKSLTSDFFLLSGSLNTIGSLDLLAATRSLRSMAIMNPEPPNGGNPVD